MEITQQRQDGKTLMRSTATGEDLVPLSQQEKCNILAAIYEMYGISPSSESVENWLIQGWDYACEGLTQEQVVRAFMLSISGKLTDCTTGKVVSVNLYGSQFSFYHFVQIINAYRSMIAQELRQNKYQQEIARQEEELRRSAEITPEKEAANLKTIITKAYNDPGKFNDWGGMMYRRLNMLDLLHEIENKATNIQAYAMARMKTEVDDIRLLVDRDYRHKIKTQTPDIEGETVRFWFWKQKNDGVDLEILIEILTRKI